MEQRERKRRPSKGNKGKSKKKKLVSEYMTQQKSSTKLNRLVLVEQASVGFTRIRSID